MKTLKPEFVEYIPENLVEGIIYVSMKYKSARHKCACGCGNIVITPFKPNQWHLYSDGDSISLSPSIGNWNFACRSHYWITKNIIQWSDEWSKVEIDNGRKKEILKAEKFYNAKKLPLKEDKSPIPKSKRSIKADAHNWKKFFNFFNFSNIIQ